MGLKKYIPLVLLVTCFLSVLPMQIPEVNAVSFTKPSESSLWITTGAMTELKNKHFSSLATNTEHSVIMPLTLGGNNASIFYSTSSLIARTNLEATGISSPKYGWLSGRRYTAGWASRIFNIWCYNTSSRFAGFTVYEDGAYQETDKKVIGFVPYNLTGFITDFDFTSINFAGSFRNATYVLSTDFQYGNQTNHFEVGNTQAVWNGTINAIVASSATRSGYIALATRISSDTTGSWSFTYSIWNSTSDYKTWIAGRRSLDNTTHGAMPTTTTNVLGMLGYNNTSTTSGTLRLRFTAYIAFGLTYNELETNLNNLIAVDPETSFSDSNDYWYDFYTQYSAVNLGHDWLNRLYYWAKHMINVAHYTEKFFGAGFGYQSGYQIWLQDAAYGCYTSMATGLWENAKRYIDNVLAQAIDSSAETRDGYATGSPYATKNLIDWQTYPFRDKSNSKGQVRSTLDTLDAIVRYVGYSGNNTFASLNWHNITNMIEAVHAVVTGTGVLPLTQASEDGDASLQTNIIYYHVLKEFTDISNNIGNTSYASTLDSRASTLKTQLNKEIGSGGLWSSTAGYFVNSSSVSPSDSDASLWLWHNALAISYDIPSSSERTQSILSKIVEKLEDSWGFKDKQRKERWWFMKAYDLAKAYATEEDSSKISKILWAMVNNPYCGLNFSIATTLPRFNFREEIPIDSGMTPAGSDYQYAWSSSPATMIIEVLFGIMPSVKNIKIQPIKPSNVSTITAINVRVRNALWNISVSGSGDYVNNLQIDNVDYYSQVIPSSCHSGSHTIKVTLGDKPSYPMLRDTTAELSSVEYDADQLKIWFNTTETTDTFKIRVGDKGEPTSISGYGLDTYTYSGDTITIECYNGDNLIISWTSPSGETGGPTGSPPPSEEPPITEEPSIPFEPVSELKPSTVYVVIAIIVLIGVIAYAWEQK